MKFRSSTSSSEAPHATGVVPWGLVTAVVILAAVELAMRQANPSDMIAYESTGRMAYHAVRQHILFDGPAEVAFVGSSRTREAFLMPRVRERLEAVLGRPVRVANYASPTANADECETIVYLLTNNGPPPRVLVYGVTPYQLATMAYNFYRRAAMWGLDDWRREQSIHDRSLRRFLPEAIRNELEAYYRTFAYRDWLSVRAKLLTGQYRRHPSPVRGEISYRHATMPYVSLESRPVTVLRVIQYLRPRLHQRRYLLGGPQREAFANLLTVAGRAGVDVLLVELPQPAILRDHLPPGTYQEFLDIVTEEAASHGIPFLPIRWQRPHLTDVDFAEQSHLNLCGAEKYTELLLDRILIPYFEGTLTPPAPFARP